MSHTDIRESGTCAALPLRDAWGRPRRTSWRSDQQPSNGTGIQVEAVSGPTHVTRTSELAFA